MDNKLNESIRADVFANKTILNAVTFRENELLNITWTGLELNFTLPDVVYDLEFRGFLDGVNTSIRLDRIHLTQKR